MPVAESLTPQQILAAQSLALGQSQGVAAQRAGVTRITVVRWLRKPHFKQKVQEFKREIEEIEGESFREAAKEVGEDIRENVRKILDQDGLKLLASEMAQNEEFSPMVRLKAAAQLGKWLGMEAPKPVGKEADNGFPIHDLEDVQDVSSLSDEELQELYLKTLAES
jgi:tyrosine-protein phosphatase YwqE